MCQCYDATDNPTHTMNAICVLDECFCVFDACPYGRLSSSPIAAQKVKLESIATITVMIIMMLHVRRDIFVDSSIKLY